jgi:hypothetical protein
MTQISTVTTLMLFGKVAFRRMLNRSRALQVNKLFHKKDETATKPVVNTVATVSETTEAHELVSSAAPKVIRQGTVHRTEQKSLLSRAIAMWLPLTTLCGLIMLSMLTMFVILDGIHLEEIKQGATWYLSAEDYAKLNAVSKDDAPDVQNAAIKEVISKSNSSGAIWLTDGFVAAAQARWQQSGINGFDQHTTDTEDMSVVSLLSPAGKITALHAVSIYLILLGLGLFSVTFGVTGKQLSGVDTELVFLWQFPVSRQVLFSARLVEYLCDNVVMFVMGLFYSVILWMYGTSFWQSVLLGSLLGVSMGIINAAARLILESYLTLRLTRVSRGMVVGVVTVVGGILTMLIMFGGNAKFAVDGVIQLGTMLPEWVYWSPATLGIGTDAMQNQGFCWYLVAPLMAAICSVVAVQTSVYLTRGGLTSPVDSVRVGRVGQSVKQQKSLAGNAYLWKFFLQLRRQPEKLAQIVGAPIMVAMLLYFSQHKNLLDMATNGAANIMVAIIVASSYMLIVASVQTIQSEAKTLWLLQCQPRPLADAIRANSRIWGTISIVICLPFLIWAMIVRPAEAVTILAHMPFMMLSIWLIAELIFGLNSLATSINNEQQVRMGYGATVIPGLIISDVCLATYSQSWWALFCSIAMLMIFNAAVRERMLIELPWLSEPTANPPKKISPIHGLVAFIGFQTVMNGMRAGLLNVEWISTDAMMMLSYTVAAVVVAIIFWIWCRSQKLKLDLTPVATPILSKVLWGIAACCTAGFLLTMMLKYFEIDVSKMAAMDESLIRHSPYDQWYLFVMLVIVAPIFEEWIFRGILYQGLRRTWGIFPAVMLTTVLFVTLHPVTSSPALLVLGIVTALTVEKTGRLWPSMLIHACYNLMIWSLMFV